jgi:hypothetical protein
MTSHSSCFWPFVLPAWPSLTPAPCGFTGRTYFGQGQLKKYYDVHKFYRHQKIPDHTYCHLLVVKEEVDQTPWWEEWVDSDSDSPTAATTAFDSPFTFPDEEDDEPAKKRFKPSRTRTEQLDWEDRRDQQALHRNSEPRYWRSNGN